MLYVKLLVKYNYVSMCVLAPCSQDVAVSLHSEARSIHVLSSYDTALPY